LVEEKLEIAKRYLIKKSEEMSGLPHQVQIDDDALKNLIRWYCREAGVGNLEKHIERIYRKCARKVVEQIEIEEAEKAEAEAAAQAEKAAQIIDEPPVEPQVVIIDTDGVELQPSETEEEISDPEPGPPPEPSMFITYENLEEYVGKPVFTSDRLYESTPVGTTMGLR
jgi:Lon-like ATP-dependent protease